MYVGVWTKLFDLKYDFKKPLKAHVGSKELMSTFCINMNEEQDFYPTPCGNATVNQIRK